MSNFDFHVLWKCPKGESCQDLIEFWLTHKALPTRGACEKRLEQVVLFARDEKGKVAGVCTAHQSKPARLDQPVFYYRSFIAPEYRATVLVLRLLRRAVSLLERDARENNWECIGVFLELENPKFNQKGRMPVWPGLDFVYIGKSDRGFECRVYWFKNARLKSC